MLVMDAQCAVGASQQCNARRVRLNLLLICMHCYPLSPRRTFVDQESMDVCGVLTACVYTLPPSDATRGARYRRWISRDRLPVGGIIVANRHDRSRKQAIST
jgi:hypothetical protein